MVQGGKVILLNGASSSGKSTLARALQARLDEPFWHISIDHLRDAGILPLERIRRGEFIWADLRAPFFNGFHLSLAAYLRAGNNLIVEHIIETGEWMRDLAGLFAPYDAYLVGVHCPVEELERREAARGDRPKGSARQDFETIHQLARYDLEIDSMLPLAANVDQVIGAWKSRSRPLAFERMIFNPPASPGEAG